MNAKTNASPEQSMTLERLQSLYELIGRMNSVYELDALLEFVVDRALHLTGGGRGLLLLSDDQSETLQKIAVVQGKELSPADRERLLQFVSTTVITDVIDQGEPRLVADLPSDQRYEGRTSHDTLEYKNIRSVLASPLKAEGHLVGLIYIDHPRRDVFNSADLDFLSAFTNQAALAINRARTHQRQLEKLTLLNELSRSVVKVLDLKEVLARIAGEVTEMLDVEASSVLLLDEKTDDLVFSTAVSHNQHVKIPRRLKKNQGVAGWVVSSGEPACLNDVTQDPRWFGEVIEKGFVTRSLLCVPLQLEGRVLGVLEALNKKDDQDFNASDITLLSAFAAWATIAIENARLFQDAQEARQLRALNQVAMTLSSSLDLNNILDEGLEQFLQLFSAEAGAIYLINRRTQTDLLTVQLGQPLSGQRNQGRTEERLHALTGLTTWLLDQGGINTARNDIFITDMLVIDSQTPPPADLSTKTLTEAGIEALAMAPVQVSQVLSGGILIMSTRPHLYTTNQLNLLSGIARIIGLAAQNAIHYLQMQAQTMHLTYLNEIGSALTRTLDLDHVLEVIIEGVNTLLQTELTSVFLIDEETNELVLRYTTRGDAEIRLAPPWQGVAGWVARRDKPALVNNTQSDPRHLRQIAVETGYQAHSILCVPLKVEGQVIGVVEVLNKTNGQQFTHYHQALLIELTKWAAIALHNARLFDERVQAYRRLSAEQQRRIAAESRGAMADIILDMAHTMNNIVGAIRVWGYTLEQAIEDTPQAPLVDFKKTVNRIRSNTEEALKLMSSMTGPLVEAEIEPIGVASCLQAAVESCWWPDNVEYTQTIAPDLPLVKANKERLEAVFHNLLSNAIQAMAQQGGTVTAKIRPLDSQWIEIVIADTGPGIPQNLQKRVFNPGVSGKDGGLGIGLWLVETFIHQFEGKIKFTSSPEQGTTFTVLLQAVYQ